MVAYHYVGNIRSKRISFFAIAITGIIHLVVALMFIFASNKNGVSLEQQSFLQVIKLKVKDPEINMELRSPSINFPIKIRPVILPTLDFDQSLHAELEKEYSNSDIPYQLPDKNSELHKNVFDPKMRKKLIDAQGFNTPRKVEKSKSWTEADGRTFVDMGDGMCLVSMSKIDSHERGTGWGMTPCGRTDSEKMMDNVLADFEARRHPLNSK